MPIMSTQNELIIELKSDETQPRVGFNASYISGWISLELILQKSNIFSMWWPTQS